MRGIILIQYKARIYVHRPPLLMPIIIRSGESSNLVPKLTECSNVNSWACGFVPQSGQLGNPTQQPETRSLQGLFIPSIVINILLEALLGNIMNKIQFSQKVSFCPETGPELKVTLDYVLARLIAHKWSMSPLLTPEMFLIRCYKDSYFLPDVAKYAGYEKIFKRTGFRRLCTVWNMHVHSCDSYLYFDLRLLNPPPRGFIGYIQIQ